VLGALLKIGIWKLRIMYRLAQEIVFGKDKKEAQEKIKKTAKERGIKLASTQRLYEKIAKGECEGFTVPAFNIRTLTFDVASALFRAARKEKAGAFILELAKSEIGYTLQSPREYVAIILAAALEETFEEPIFFQGDHYKLESKKYFNKEKREGEIKSLESLIKESIEAGFLNIDIDCSNLADLKKPEISEQQRDNFTQTAYFASFIRELEPKDMEVSIGGEVGEIGGKNTTIEELRAFMKGFDEFFRKEKLKKGLIKIACQTGTSHGGTLLPSGEFKAPEEDFRTLGDLSKEAKKYGMAGAVQHGASTLPDEYFDRFPETGACEIHLATQFQNIIFQSSYFPEELKERMYQWMKDNFKKEKKPTENEIQFLYRLRKKALGPFKKDIWQISQKNINKICEELEEKFIFFFRKLNVSGTLELIRKTYQ